MDNGRIIENNNSDEFFNNPKEDRTKLFLDQIFKTLMALNKLNVFELTKGIANGDFSPKEILDDCIKRINLIDPKLNAFPIKCFDKAYDQIKIYHP